MAAYDRKHKEDVKQQIANSFTLADAISTRIAYLFEDPKTRREENILQPWDVFPELFEERKEEAEEKKRLRELERYKAKMALYAARWNTGD